MDPFIIHIGCKEIKDAETLLQLKNKSGIKRGGIIVLQKGKIMFEFLGTQKMGLPIKQGNKLLVSEKYLKKIIEIANKKLEKNFKQIERLEKNAKKMLK
jgi:tRNA wybutosine-synthesizing protein 3